MLDLLNTFQANLSMGFAEALTLQNLWYCFLGVTLGTVIGVLPGLGALLAITLLLPFTYHLPTTGALIMIAGIYFGADYGGGTCSILLGVPGHPAAAIDVLDGYPMAKQGRGGVALFMKAIASFIGSSIGILLLMFAAPALSDIAISFGAIEYCALMLLGLVAASTISGGSPLKGVAMTLAGMLIATIGADGSSGIERFSFDMPNLAKGIGIIPLAMGVFALAEVISSVGKSSVTAEKPKLGLRDQLPTKEDWRLSAGPIVRGSGLGSILGTLPGAGGGVATFISYALEMRLARDPKRFGKGAIEVIAGPEAANNAGVGTAFIPTLTLGIPGDAVMALILAALLIQGIQPGPDVISSHPELFWGLIASFWIGNLLLLVLNIPLIGIWVRLLSVPYRFLFPAIVMFTCIGVFSEGNNVFDVWLLLGFGTLGYLMHLVKLPPVPLLLGLILGPLFEENLRKALLLNRGDLTAFLSNPVSAAALLLCAVIVFLSIRKTA